MTAQGIKDRPGAPYDTQHLLHNVQPFNQPDLKWVCYEAHIPSNTQAKPMVCMSNTRPMCQTLAHDTHHTVPQS